MIQGPSLRAVGLRTGAEIVTARGRPGVTRADDLQAGSCGISRRMAYHGNLVLILAVIHLK